MSFFAFPLNLIISLIWVIAVFLSYRLASVSRVVRFMLSPAATLISIGLFSISCLVIGLTGNREWIRSVPFIIIYIFLMTVLLYATIRPRFTEYLLWALIPRIASHVIITIVTSCPILLW